MEELIETAVSGVMTVIESHSNEDKIWLIGEICERLYDETDGITMMEYGHIEDEDNE